MYIKCSDENSYDNARAFSDNVRDRISLAVNTKSPELLEIYAYDPEPMVRNAVAHNLNTPPEVLAELISDSDYGVRVTAARNPYIPSVALIDFITAKDIYEGVDALFNSKLPADVIDDYYKRANAIISDPAYNYEDNEGWHDDYIYALSRNPNTPEYILAELVDQCDEFCFMGLVENPNTPDYVLITVARESESPSTLVNVAAHDNVTDDAYLELINNRNSDVDVYYEILDNLQAA